MSDSNSGILVGTADDRVCVRVEGKGTHLNSQSLREFLFAMVDKGYRKYRVDLSQCTYMDSTFLGMLVGVSLRLRQLGPAKIAIARINPRNLELFQTLGIEPFFQIEPNSDQSPNAAEPGLEALPDSKASVEKRAEIMLEAHETLAQADQRNVCRFKDVIAFLKEDLGRVKSAQTPPAGSDSDRH